MTYLGDGKRVPYLEKWKIAREVEKILGEDCWAREAPVDLERLCDKLGIGIVPVSGLSEDFCIDAFIAANFKIMYVDSDEFEKESYRYKFSVAHELGHFVLHREYADGLEDLNGYAEFQANYFAGCLLVPENGLTRILNEEFGGSFARNYWDVSLRKIGDALEKVQKYFMVSDQVVMRRMRETFPGIKEDF